MIPQKKINGIQKSCTVYITNIIMGYIINITVTVIAFLTLDFNLNL